MHKPTPFQKLGERLKYVREQRRETLAEAAGAVEIDTEVLDRIESGHERPSEDILLLLMDHFGVHEQDAVQIWETAGYTGNIDGRDVRPRGMEQLEKGAAVVVLAMDMRTQYSDGVEVTANQAGIVLQFTQESANGSQPVSRVGMSYQQAQAVLDALQRAVLHGQAGYTQPRLGQPHQHND